MTDIQSPLVPCPFVYAKGRRCTGHVERVEAYKADVVWEMDKEGKWKFEFSPRSHYHLFCSKKGNHSGFRRPDNDAMTFYYDELPEPLQKVIGGTDVVNHQR